MFDRAIIDTDKFTDLPVSAKALYFLLGMEADDEGFVSPKRVLRVHGGTADDVNVLIAKELVIPFDSGVVVITDWLTNNYLNRNRIKPTQYREERSMLTTISVGRNRNTNDKKYVLTHEVSCLFNDGLTNVKLEEKRIEEKRIKESAAVPPSQSPIPVREKVQRTRETLQAQGILRS